MNIEYGIIRYNQRKEELIMATVEEMVEVCEQVESTFNETLAELKKIFGGSYGN